MFESIARPPAATRRRKVFFAVSAAVHTTALAAFLVATMWRIEKLGFQREHVALASMPPPPPGNSGGGQRMKDPDKTQKTPTKRPVRDHVQPTHVSVHEEAGGREETKPGDGGGGDGKGTGIPTLGGGCIEGQIGCLGSTITLPDPPVIEEKKPCTDPSRANDPDCAPPVIPDVERLRLSGETQIQPSDTVKIRMQREGESRLTGVVQVCLDAAGAVTGVSRLRSTGYDEYDERLLAGVRGWRYKPATSGGRAVAACGPVTFHFALR